MAANTVAANSATITFDVLTGVSALEAGQTVTVMSREGIDGHVAIGLGLRSPVVRVQGLTYESSKANAESVITDAYTMRGYVGTVNDWDDDQFTGVLIRDVRCGTPKAVIRSNTTQYLVTVAFEFQYVGA